MPQMGTNDSYLGEGRMKTKCDGSKLDCVKLVKDCQGLEEKWSTLKNVITAMSARAYLTEEYNTGDYRAGFDDALSRVEDIIKKLEES